MRFKGLDLNLLAALDVLLQERNVSAAGRRLFLSQSATSGALARLREHFCDELLIQVGRTMVPTPFGEGLIQPLRQLMLQIEVTVSPGGGFDPATTMREFRISCSDYITEVLLCRIIPRMAKEAPGAILDIVPPGNDQAGALESGEIDLLISPDIYSSPLHPTEHLYEEGHVVVAWDGNAVLADGHMDEERFRTLGHVVARFARFRSPSFAEGWLDAHVPERRIELVAPSFTQVPRLIVGTDRITIMHRRLAEIYATHLPIRLYDPPFDLPCINEVSQRHRARQTDGGLKWLNGLLRDVAASLT